ncbi:olfactory receptor 24-like [Astyanax mexicanus]|uniref:Olfactory receptor n=1 Tax=Astyanax mexicanus TaxID=7994 RepID=A0A8T2L0J9_ASTMX|nr:olfactory receptor 24-like [Astyanax mexicanus]
MANETKDTIYDLNTVFVLKSMNLSGEIAYITVIIALPAYIFAVVSNLLIIVTVIFNRTMHEPMYILLCNLSLNDIFGISAMVPRSIFNIMFEYGLVTFPECILQAWFLHLYGGTTLLILSVMAFDRYIAICHPLTYHAIMSKTFLLGLIAFSWLTTCFLCFILFCLTLRHPFCRKDLPSYYCDNVSILRVTCATDITVNNVYGLFITGFFHGVGLFSVIFSYTWIIITCCKTKDSESKSKAWHTCGTHLAVFLIYEVSSSAVVLLHRFPNTPPTVQRIMGLVYVIVPNCLNPVIYGLKTKDVKSKMKFLKNRIFGMNKLKPAKSEQVKAITTM